MKKYLMFLSLFAALVSCDKQKENVSETLSGLMQGQEIAWNSGDIQGFMDGVYLESEDLLFVGKNGLKKGYAVTLNNYLKSYPDQAAMGQLQFDNLEFKALGSNHHLVIGKWTLFREQDTLGGHYSLVWEKRAEGWRIIADHSS